MTRVEIEYSLHNQVLRAAFSLETLTHYVPRKIFLIFLRTAVRESGDDGKWSENDDEVEMHLLSNLMILLRTAVLGQRGLQNEKYSAPHLSTMHSFCRDNNHITVKYSLDGIQRPLGVSEYGLSQALEERLKKIGTHLISPALPLISGI